MFDKFIVSTKLALYSQDGSSVLIMRYPTRGHSGLPGGHVDRGEDPDFALHRELMEELSMTVDNVERKDFFLRETDSGPIILAYIARATGEEHIEATNPRREFAEWVLRDYVADIPNMSAEYKRFILANWPQI